MDVVVTGQQQRLGEDVSDLGPEPLVDLVAGSGVGGMAEALTRRLPADAQGETDLGPTTAVVACPSHRVGEFLLARGHVVQGQTYAAQIGRIVGGHGCWVEGVQPCRGVGGCSGELFL